MQPLRDYLCDIDVHSTSAYIMHDKVERKFSMHSHEKGQLTYVEGGVAYCNLPDRSYMIPARHYIWIPKLQEHYIQIRHSKTTIIHSIYFFSHHDHLTPFYTQLGIYPVTELLQQMIRYSGRWQGDILPGEQGFSFLSAIKDILPDVSKSALPVALPTTQHERLQPVLQYISQHFDQPLTLESVSHAFDLSPRTLSRLFNNTLDMSFMQYLKTLRVVKGIEMILQTNQTLSEIAYQTGYGSIAAFSKVFYQLTNKRPSSFQQDVY